MHLTGWEAEYLENKHEYNALFEEVMAQKQETDISFLENRLAKMHGREYAIAVGSGTDALHFILRSLGIGAFGSTDEVLVTNFSWISSASCVLMAGGTPVFCDINPDTYHMSMDSIIDMTTDNTKAIIYPQLFGNVTDTRDIRMYCRDLNIDFIEDACQAIGASWRGMKAGGRGAPSALSFNANKNIAGIAGGGAVLTDSEDMATYCRKIRQHGDGEFLGFNSKMLLLNAKVIDHRLNKLDEFQMMRQSFADMYTSAFDGQPIIVQNDPDVDHSYHKYVVRFEDKETRDRIQKLLNASIHYDKPLIDHGMWLQAQSEYRVNQTPNAREVTDTIMTLPLTHTSSPQDIGWVIKQIWENL